jgi:hypothetical protein
MTAEAYDAPQTCPDPDCAEWNPSSTDTCGNCGKPLKVTTPSGRAPNGTNVPNAERCRAMTIRSGDRCPNRAKHGEFCKRHAEHGAVVPDGWTSPDNLPVWLYEVPTPATLVRA